MRYNLLILFSIVLLGAGCSSPVAEEKTPDSMTHEEALEVTSSSMEPDDLVEDNVYQLTFPLDGGDVTYKRFGEYFEDRFTGYHVGEDFEIPASMPDPVSVYAIADGVVSRAARVGGYGGLVTIVHRVEGQEYTAIYGHLSTRFLVREGDTVTRGQQIGVLGADKSPETDGERRHLHFAIKQGNTNDIKGYELNEAAVDEWENPRDFLSFWGGLYPDISYRYSDLIDPQGKKIFGDLDFELPAGWDVEYLPSLEALNIFETSSGGTALDRSQILIRYFDATDFLTLSTVEIFETKDTTVGQGAYVARQYDIMKKDDIADFVDQPDWRNERHIVTDFRLQDGLTRYYVVAAAPWVDPGVYTDLLDSMVISE